MVLLSGDSVHLTLRTALSHDLLKFFLKRALIDALFFLTAGRRNGFGATPLLAIDNAITNALFAFPETALAHDSNSPGGGILPGARPNSTNGA